MMEVAKRNSARRCMKRLPTLMLLAAANALCARGVPQKWLGNWLGKRALRLWASGLVQYAP